MKIEKSTKLGILTIVSLLTAFPLGSISKNLILVSLGLCGFFAFLFWIQCCLEEDEFCKKEDERIENVLLKENENYYQKMKYGKENLGVK